MSYFVDCVKRLKLVREKWVGFRSGSGCITSLLDTCWKIITRIVGRHIVNPDIIDTFDSLDRNVLLNFLLEMDLPEKLINILKALHTKTSGIMRFIQTPFSIVPIQK